MDKAQLSAAQSFASAAEEQPQPLPYVAGENVALYPISTFFAHILQGDYGIEQIIIKGDYYATKSFYAFTFAFPEPRGQSDAEGFKRFYDDMAKTIEDMAQKGKAPDVNLDNENASLSAIYLEDIVRVLRHHSNLHKLNWDKSTAQLGGQASDINQTSQPNIDDPDILSGLYAPNGYITLEDLYRDASRCKNYMAFHDNPRPLFTLDDLDRVVVAENLIRHGRTDPDNRPGLWYH